MTALISVVKKGLHSLVILRGWKSAWGMKKELLNEIYFAFTQKKKKKAPICSQKLYFTVEIYEKENSEQKVYSHPSVVL